MIFSDEWHLLKPEFIGSDQYPTLALPFSGEGNVSFSSSPCEGGGWEGVSVLALNSLSKRHSGR